MKSKNGFTLIEIIIVISIILIISGIGIGIYANSRKHLVVDLDADKLIALLHSLREEAKTASPAKCLGIRFSNDETPLKIESSFDSDSQSCASERSASNIQRSASSIQWGAETVIADILLDSSTADDLSVLFVPPFGEIEFSPAGSESEITLSFKRNPSFFKKINLNSLTGKFQKI